MNGRQPDSIETSAMAVVICKGKILATIENIYGKVTLSLPKGHQEQNELLIETAIRECFEETNVVVTQQNFVKELTPYSYEFLTPSNKLIRKTVVPFLFEIADEGHPMPKEKRMVAVQWMNVDDFLPNCTHDNVRLTVAEIL